MKSLSLYLCILYFVGLLCSGGAQWTPERIITNTGGVSVTSVGVIPNRCTSVDNVLVKISNNVTGCLAFINQDGGTIKEVCNPAFVGAAEVSCSVYGGCHITNPVLGNIVVVDNFNDPGFLFGTYGAGNLTAPVSIATYSYFNNMGGYSETFVIDTNAGVNSLWYFLLPTYIDNETQVAGELLHTFTATGTPAGIFRSDITQTVYASILHDTAIQTFGFDGRNNVPYDFPAITDVGAMNVDAVGRLMVYDYGCSCIRVILASDSFLIDTITPENPVLTMEGSLNHLFVVDAVGVVRYEEKFEVTVNHIRNKRCAESMGSVEFTHTGGAYPIKYTLYPGATTVEDSTYEVNSTHSFKNLDALPELYNATVFSERISNSFEYYSEMATYGLVNTSEISGSNSSNGEYAFGLTFEQSDPWATRYFLMFCFFDCFEARMNTVEFYINVGDGGQEFTIDFTDTNSPFQPKQTHYIYGSNFTRNQWEKVTIKLTFGGPWARMIFTDIAKTSPSNPIYFDNFVVIPEQISTYYFTIKDACGQSFTSSKFEINNNSTMTASVATHGVTCNPLQTNNGVKTFDGFANATVSNGEFPYQYQWVFPGAVDSLVSNITSLTNYITIYDNQVNSTDWFDASLTLGGNPQDSTYYHSAPYSYSLPMPFNGDSLSLQFSHRGVLIPAHGATLTFWVNGGVQGGQSLCLRIFRYSELLTIVDDIRLIMGVATILPNRWMKATYVFDLSVIPNGFTSVQLGANGELSQDTIYIDDIVLTLFPALVVLDVTGCSATVLDIAISTPPSLEIAPTFTNVKCFGSNDGAVDLNVQGGVSPYQYQWEVSGTNVTGGASMQGLKESRVVASITDTNGCATTQTSQSILQPPQLGVSIDVEPITCNGGLATLTAYMYGGNAPYTYAWSSATKVDIVPQPAPTPIFVDSITTVNSNGQVVCLGTGSHMGLTYQPTHSGYCSLAATFNTSAPSVVISGLSIATSKHALVEFWVYLENAQDAQNLQVSVSRNGVSASTALSFSALSNNITANAWNHIAYNISGATNASPNQLVFTSTSPASMGRVLFDDIVLIPKVSSSVGIVVYPGYKSVLTGKAGLYFLTVVDANGCSFLHTVNISQPTALSIKSQTVGATSTTARDGSILVSAAGGSPPYTFLWLESNFTGTNFSGLVYGGHPVRVTDANGCTFTTTVVVQLDERFPLRDFNKNLASGLAAVAAVGIALGLFALFIMVKYRRSHSKLGGFYNTVITVGVILGCISVVMLLPRPTDGLCTAYPWLLGTAFVLVYSCLFLKTYALYRVWRKAINYQKSNLTTAKIVRTIAMALLAEYVLLAIWTAVDPPRVRQVKVSNDTLEEQCDTKHPTFWILFVTFKGIWLVFGAVMSILTRNVMKEFNESTNIAYAIYNILVLMVIAIPIASLLGVVPGGRLVIEVLVPVLAFTSTLVIMFFGIWHAAFFGSPQDTKLPGMKANNPQATHTTATNMSTVTSSNSKGSGSKDSHDSKGINLSAEAI